MNRSTYYTKVVSQCDVLNDCLTCVSPLLEVSQGNHCMGLLTGINLSPGLSRAGSPIARFNYINSLFFSHHWYPFDVVLPISITLYDPCNPIKINNRDLTFSQVRCD